MARPSNTIQTILLYANKQDDAPCWIWWGATLSNGYPKVTMNYRTCLVHRVVYEHYKGSIPEGLQIDHICKNKLCVNPEHLEAVTCLENMRRRYANYTHCVNGHELSGENVYIAPYTGKRDCKVCRKAASMRYQQRNR
jgi:hypothetical protein